MLKYGNKSHAILCVYMPCMAAASANDDIFLEYLGILLATIDELECTCVSIIDDWNADVSNGNHQFGNYLNEFCRDTGLSISSELLLPIDNFTYKSDSWHTTSWLYHCISTKDGHGIICDMEILYGESIGDHIPVCIGTSTDCIPILDDNNNGPSGRLDWGRLNNSQIERYNLLSDCQLENVYIPVEAVNGKDVNCKHESHVHEMNALYDNVVSVP